MNNDAVTELIGRVKEAAHADNRIMQNSRFILEHSAEKLADIVEVLFAACNDVIEAGFSHRDLLSAADDVEAALEKAHEIAERK